MNKDSQTNTTAIDANTKLLPVILENLSDAELLKIADELQNDTVANDSVIRILAKQYFGGDSLTQIIFVSMKILPVICDRLRCCSPHL